ncbi:hypothetical protein Droror1_Dr00000197 [Drosera rotundifolia]
MLPPFMLKLNEFLLGGLSLAAGIDVGCLVLRTILFELVRDLPTLLKENSDLILRRWCLGFVNLGVLLPLSCWSSKCSQEGVPSVVELDVEAVLNEFKEFAQFTIK